MPTEEARRQRRLTLLIAGTALFCSLLASATSAYIVWYRTSENRNLICDFDKLFGLDRPVPAIQFKKLRPIQKKALAKITSECPSLTKGGRR